jgi:hypothetical protein
MCPGPAFARFSNHQLADPIHALVPLFRQRLLVLKPVPHRVQPLDEVSKFNRARRTVSRATAIASS